MSTEENKALLRRLVDAVNDQDTAALKDILAADLAGRWIEEAIPWLYATFAEHHIDVTDMMAEGDKVWARLVTSGRHAGEWLSLPATGRVWTNSGAYFAQISGAKIVKMESLFDDGNLAKQLGATLTAVAP